MDARRRRELGAWYTPPALVDAVVAAVLHDWNPPRGRAVRVLDPACGDGRFLAATADALAARGVQASLFGVDIDPGAVDAARAALAGRDAAVECGDALAGWAAGGQGRLDLDDGAARPRRAPTERFDLVVGNPPFLSPLAGRNERVARSSPAGAPYADAATQFLLLGWHLLATAGRVGFVLPESVLANRDAAVVRRAIDEHGALRWIWWSPDRLFDAAVRTCAIVAERGAAESPVRRQTGPDFTGAPDAAPAGDAWAGLVSDLRGVPPIAGIDTDGSVGDRAVTGAGFRDEFYGVAAAVADDADGPKLVTSGLIDPGRCRWGERSVRVARRVFLRPHVDLSALQPPIERWARRQLVPKVLIASQTKVIEALADPAGELIPGVPVVTAIPRRGSADEVWRLAAVLTNPVTSAALAHRAAGSGLSGGALRVSASAVAALPWPAGSLDDAVACLRAGDIDRCGAAALRAYGAAPADELLSWWREALPKR